MLNDKSLKSVADAVGKIMAEALKGDQHKIDKNKNNKIDAHDFKLLRKEGWDDMVKSAKDAVKSGPKPNGGAGVKQGTAYGGGKQKDEKPVKEDIEQLDEIRDVEQYKAKIAKEKEHVKKIEAGTTMKPGEDGRMKRHFPDPESYYAHNEKTERIAKMEKALAKHQSKTVKEESSQAEFTAELKKAQAKAAGKAKQADVAKPAVQAVQNEETHTEIQVVDFSDVNGVKMSTIDLQERELTSSEKAKMEKNVKGMKKNLAGFKERYGKDAKSVMYATATKQAKGE